MPEQRHVNLPPHLHKALLRSARRIRKAKKRYDKAVAERQSWIDLIAQLCGPCDIDEVSGVIGVVEKPEEHDGRDSSERQ